MCTPWGLGGGRLLGKAEAGGTKARSFLGGISRLSLGAEQGGKWHTWGHVHEHAYTCTRGHTARMWPGQDWNPPETVAITAPCTASQV